MITYNVGWVSLCSTQQRFRFRSSNATSYPVNILAIAKVEDFSISDLTPSVFNPYIQYIDVPIGSAEFMIATHTIEGYEHGTLGHIDLPMGVNAVGVIDFASIEDDSKSIFKFVKDLGIDTAGIHFGAGVKKLGTPEEEFVLGMDAIIQGDFSLLPDFVRGDGPFDIRFQRAVVHGGLTSKKGGETDFTAGIEGNLLLRGYDPTKSDEPDLDLYGSLGIQVSDKDQKLKGAFQVRTLKEEDVDGDGELDLVPGGAWVDPFGIPDTEIRNLALALEGTFKKPFITGVGLIGDMKMGNYNLKSAFNLDINDPQKFAIQLTALERVNLRDILTQFLFPGSTGILVSYLLEQGANSFDPINDAIDFVDKILDVNVVSADSLDEDEGIDDLIERQQSLLQEKLQNNATQEDINEIKQEIDTLKQKAIDVMPLIEKRQKEIEEKEKNNGSKKEIDLLEKEIDVLQGTLDPLIKFVTDEVTIAQEVLTPGLGVNAEVELWGARGFLSLNANPFSSLPTVDGFLKIPKLDVGNLGQVIISGVEAPVAGGTDTDLNLELKVTPTEQYFRGDGRVEILGREIAKADFKISPSGVEIKDFDFDLSLMKLDVNNLAVYSIPKNIDGVNVIAQGEGSFQMLGHVMAGTDFKITTSGIDINYFKLPVGIFELNVNDFLVDFNNPAASGQANVKLLNQEVAGVDFEFTPEKFELKEFDLSISPFFKVDVNNLVFDPKTGNSSGTGALKMLGQTDPVGEIKIENTGDRLTIDGDLDLLFGLVEVEDAKIDIKGFGNAEIVGAIKFLDRELADTRISLQGKQLIIEGGIDLDIPILGSVSADIKVISDGTIEGSRVNVDSSVADFNLSLGSLNSIDDLITSVMKEAGGEIVQAFNDTVEFATETWNDTVNLASGTLKTLGGAWNYGVDFISNVFEGVEESVLKVWEWVESWVTTNDPNWSQEVWLGDGNQFYNGEGGNDTIGGGNGEDHLIGGDGDDRVYGGHDNDKLEGWRGRDYLNGEWGNDHIYGNEGDDHLLGGDGKDWLEGGDGNDKLNGQRGNDLLFGHNGNDHLVGEAGDDLLHGEWGNDTLRGGSGSDKLQGGDGDDLLEGESGNDLIYGNEGDDSLIGGDGDDQLYGNEGNDQLYGWRGRDILRGGSGNDLLHGDEDDDLLEGESGQDTLRGGSGQDLLRGGDGDDLLEGEWDNDLLYGDAGSDSLDGGDGNDFLNGGSGDDTLKGGQGNDVLIGGSASFKTIFIKSNLDDSNPTADALKGDFNNLIVGDFDGDGDDDFIRQEKGSADDDDNWTAIFFRSNGDGTFSDQGVIDDSNPNSDDFKGDGSNLIVGDFNGDGKDDFIRQEKGDWDDDDNNTANLFISNGDGSFTKQSVIDDSNPNSDDFKGDGSNLIVGDFNGDGKDDFIRQEKGVWDDDDNNTANLFISNGDGSFTKQNVIDDGNPTEDDFKGDGSNLIVGDFNGDGKDDFIRQEKGVWDDDEYNTANLFISNGDGSFTKQGVIDDSNPNSDDFKGDGSNLMVGDFNGDGNDDFIRQEKGDWDDDDNNTANVFLSQDDIEAGGNDLLEGGEGDDRLEGNAGDDLLKGGLGNDTLKGNEDNDWLVGELGEDILIGGGGADVFYFNAPNEGGDQILDFDTSQGDKIQISANGFDTNSLTDFSFVAGTLEYKGQEIALIQNNGQSYNNFGELSNIIEIVNEPIA